jgi:hypothetical protein
VLTGTAAEYHHFHNRLLSHTGNGPRMHRRQALPWEIIQQSYDDLRIVPVLKSMYSCFC